MPNNTTVCLLTRNSAFARAVSDMQENYDVDVIVGVGRMPLPFFRKRANTQYNIIAVDKWYKGNSLSTSQFVSSLREFYRNPIIAVEIAMGGGDVFALQVAGCNFALTTTGIWVSGDTIESAMARELITLAEQIGKELTRFKFPRSRKIAA